MSAAENLGTKASTAASRKMRAMMHFIVSISNSISLLSRDVVIHVILLHQTSLIKASALVLFLFRLQLVSFRGPHKIRQFSLCVCFGFHFFSATGIILSVKSTVYTVYNSKYYRILQPTAVTVVSCGPSITKRPPCPEQECESKLSEI
jgi:hypothetical protein